MIEEDAIDLVLRRMAGFGKSPAVSWRDREVTYVEFLDLIAKWRIRLSGLGIGSGSVCGLFGDYSPQTCSLIFALMQARAIIAPFTQAPACELERSADIAGLEFLFRFDEQDHWAVEKRPPEKSNRLIRHFSQQRRSGLVFFTSGSSGAPKGILHDAERVAQKFATKRAGWRTVMFLMMDHFGGFNTLLGAFAYGGTAICPIVRSPGQVCQLIESQKATLLPTTPTFLNMMCTSPEAHKYDLASIKLITYGTELMSEATLQRVQHLFPGARLKQTYGVSELGVLSSRSSDDGSTWVKIGGEGFETRILNGILWVRSRANMVGYLNEANPFDDDGWFCTGDEVDQDDEYVRFLGRKSDIINVGGQKVSPVEVESVVLEANNVRDVTAYASPHPVFGQVVNAQVSLIEAEGLEEMSIRLRRHCLDRMARHKVPMRFVLVRGDIQRSARFKKKRHVKKEAGVVDVAKAN